MTSQPNPLHDLLLNELPRRQHSMSARGYVYIGSSDCPVTTEMYVAGNQLKGSFNLMGVMSETWLALLLQRVTQQEV